MHILPLKLLLYVKQKVDVTTVQPISAYYSSDEEKDDEDILLYLPIAPEVEEPEDGWNPSAELDDGAPSGTKRSHQDQKEHSSPKKKRTKSYEISLANAPTDGNIRNDSSFQLIAFLAFLQKFIRW